MQPTKRKCLVCGHPIQGRADKKFCTEQCRNSHHNQLNRDVNQHVRNINNILRKNRRILADLNPTGQSKVHRDRLLTRGFNFEYFTACYQNQTVTVYYCYEQGYVKLDDGFVELLAKIEKQAWPKKVIHR